MNIKNKLLVVCFIIATLFTIFTITFPIQVKASDISTYAYYDPNTVSFRGRYTDNSNYYDGRFMAFEATATASDGKSYEVIVSVYIASKNTTKNYRIHTDGKTRKADYISIGNGSDAIISATCADSSVIVNLDLKMYSWN